MIGRVLYGAVFCVVLPALLVLWCRSTEPLFIAWPMPDAATARPLGWTLAAAGLTLILAGWAALWFKGGGLPMNAFPPARRVESGIYSFIDHPIYAGAALIVAGLSLAFQSRSGLWGATPLLTAAIAALVWGFESERTSRLLGPRRTQARLRLPPSSRGPATAWDRASAYLIMFLPWGVLYEGIGHIPVGNPVGVHLPFEHAWPVLTWTVPVYTSCYVFALAAPLAARSREDIRHLMLLGWWGTLIGMTCYLALPLVAPPRGEPFGVFAPWLALERADALEGRAAIPSFHVFWACAAAWMLSRRFPRAAPLWWIWAALISASCITTGMHALADIPAGFVLFIVALRAWAIWSAIHGLSQRLANTWAEARLGPMRILLHAPLAFLAAASGAALICVFTPEAPRAALWTVALGGLVGAALWGQAIEYSGKLARPFGYYGHLIGSAIALSVCCWLGWAGWDFAAALCTAAPLVQALGRLRCLVNGCCHGRPCDPRLGIVCTNPRSRVVRLAGLSGVAVHPTQAYSALCNLVILALVLRLWWSGAPASSAVALYLVLSGLARFVEEHYRGEPQTPVIAGLHSYQWLATLSVLIGAAALTITSSPLRWPSAPAPTLVLDAALIGLLYAAAMGVDFPGSSRRLARLA